MSGLRGTMIGMKITFVKPEGLVASPAFSHVAVVPPGATTIYVGGQNGVDAAGAIVDAEIGAQASRALDNVETALGAVGATLADVIAYTVLIQADADISRAYGAIAPRLSRSGPPPLVTAMKVQGLGVAGALIEVSAIAALCPA
jgi:enamine deaminase RidA (YjgF/YER057c/UK114 family)